METVPPATTWHEFSAHPTSNPMTHPWVTGLFDLDGNSTSTRFYRLLSRRAVVLKQTWFHEWHDDRLIPWAHYILVTMSMEELPALMDFLINDPEGEQLSAETIRG
ncbi:glycosyl transferase family 90 domain-containing protein [Penicillium argentinense]|uniref:Glycosyl transferase family 90 domain-containing protein n=1 Tax=Penicillium argentinense TaxID=1131581 RepID=A0A9W9G4V0_9EURO|nr:glycosyl transferase family 90 domain-containing protein [Penicillium argentinense]KAJ5111993.1 glycosyl transferase family 90 domain-containing protein [Penicillium argentinense]